MERIILSRRSDRAKWRSATLEISSWFDESVSRRTLGDEAQGLNNPFPRIHSSRTSTPSHNRSEAAGPAAAPERPPLSPGTHTVWVGTPFPRCAGLRISPPRNHSETAVPAAAPERPPLSGRNTHRLGRYAHSKMCRVVHFKDTQSPKASDTPRPTQFRPRPPR